METKLSVEDLEHDVGAALERVRGGGRVVVERDGEPVAMLGPLPPERLTTWRDLAEALRDVPSPDDEFAADLARIRAEQPTVRIPEWPD